MSITLLSYHKYPIYRSFSPLTVSLSFIPDTLNKFLLRTYYVHSTEKGTRDTVMNKIDHGPCPHKESWEDRH